MNYRLLALTLAVAACGRGSGGSPTCGIAFLAGPSLITQQLGNARAVLTDPPRGVPDSLPALVILQKTRDIGAVLVGQAPAFPSTATACWWSTTPRSARWVF